MTEQSRKVLSDALALPPIERAELVEQLLTSFDFPARADVDAAWAAEAEQRIDAYDRGEMSASPADEVFDRLNRGRKP
jgi:putative addiction module component (TIGR02574 family)